MATQAAGQCRIAAIVSQPDGEKSGRKMWIGQSAEGFFLPPEVACTALVDIKGELVARLHVRPECSELAEPALTLGVSTKT